MATKKADPQQLDLPGTAVAAAKAKAFKLPKSLAACADLLFTTKAERLDASKIVKAFADIEAKLKNHLIMSLPKGDASGIAGRLARATIVTQPVASVKDAEAVWKWIKAGRGKRDNFIAPPALNMEAINELIDQGKPLPPGVEKFNVVKVSLNKL